MEDALADPLDNLFQIIRVCFDDPKRLLCARRLRRRLILIYGAFLRAEASLYRPDDLLLPVNSSLSPDFAGHSSQAAAGRGVRSRGA